MCMSEKKGRLLHANWCFLGEEKLIKGDKNAYFLCMLPLSYCSCGIPSNTIPNCMVNYQILHWDTEVLQHTTH